MVPGTELAISKVFSVDTRTPTSKLPQSKIHSAQSICR